MNFSRGRWRRSVILSYLCCVRMQLCRVEVHLLQPFQHQRSLLKRSMEHSCYSNNLDFLSQACMGRIRIVKCECLFPLSAFSDLNYCMLWFYLESCVVVFFHVLSILADLCEVDFFSSLITSISRHYCVKRFTAALHSSSLRFVPSQLCAVCCCHCSNEEWCHETFGLPCSASRTCIMDVCQFTTPYLHLICLPFNVHRFSLRLLSSHSWKII